MSQIKFATQKTLRDHERKTHVERVECPECNMTFINSDSKKKHVRTRHDKFSQVKCDHCEKYFINKDNLKRHILTSL